MTVVKYFMLPVITIALLLYCTAAVAFDRIVSLAPNMTEVLFAIGLGDKVVGVTTFCDYPEEAKKKPKVGGMSNPSLEAVVSLKPDIVVMTTDGNPKEFEERLRRLGIKTYVSRARRIRELPDEIRDMGSALGAKEKADETAEKIQKAMEEFKGIRTTQTGKKILFVVWPEPLMVAGFGTAIDDAITLLGYTNIASMPDIAGARSPYPKYSIEEAIRGMPDIIFIGKGMSDGDMKALSERLLRRLKGTPALKNKKVFYVGDGLYRLGPRVIQGIEEMAELLKR